MLFSSLPWPSYSAAAATAVTVAGAPVQVVPDQAYNVTAPIDGVIERIERAPNARIEKGDTLFVFDDTTLKNKYALSDREVGIAEADYRRSMQGAFSRKLEGR